MLTFGQNSVPPQHGQNHMSCKNMITTFEPLDLGVRSWTTLSKSFGERVG